MNLETAASKLKKGLKGNDPTKPKPAWIPDYHARITIRFEEYDRAYYGPVFDGVRIVGEDDSATGLEGASSVGGAMGALESAASALSGGLKGTPSGKTGDDLGIITDKDKVIRTNVPVLGFTLKRNGFNLADQLEISIPLHPFYASPEVIRAVEVELFGGLVSAESRSQAYIDNKITPVHVEDGFENLLFKGYADSMKMDEASGVLSLSCRDYTALLLDSNIPAHTAYHLNLNQALDKVIKDLLVSNPVFEKLTVKPRHFDGDLPIPRDFQARAQAELTSVAEQNAAAQQRGNRQNDTNRKDIVPRDKEQSYWEFLENVCLEVGVTPVIYHDTLLLEPSTKAIEDKSPRLWTEPPTIILGYNAERPVIERNLTRDASVPVCCVSLDTKTGKETKVWVPKQEDTKKHPTWRGIDWSDTSPRIFSFPGIASEEQLRAIAEDLHNRITRRATTIQFKTTDFDGYHEAQSDVIPMFLHLYAGDPVVVMRKAVTADDSVSKGNNRMAQIAGMKLSDIVAILKSEGYHAKVAQTIATAIMEGIGTMTQRYMVEQLTITYSGESQEKQTSFDFTLNNYIVARKPAYIVDETAGPNAGAYA